MVTVTEVDEYPDETLMLTVGVALGDILSIRLVCLQDVPPTFTVIDVMFLPLALDHVVEVPSKFTMEGVRTVIVVVEQLRISVVLTEKEEVVDEFKSKRTALLEQVGSKP